MKTGSCLCGGVAFRISGPMRPVIACHCTQCRKQTGNFGAFTDAQDMHIHMEKQESLTWYRASDAAKRGFCKNCGSVLFWKSDAKTSTAIAAGSLDGASGLTLEGHIFCADAGDYYEISGGSYQKEQW
jgi:hypothetical protein